MKSRFCRRTRRGTVLVLSAILMVVVFTMLAFAVDLGLLYVTRAQLQRTADTAAMAAAWELIDEGALASYGDPLLLEQNARSKAAEFAGFNEVLRQAPQLAEEDIQIGYLAHPSDPSEALDFTGAMSSNAVRVVVRRTAEQNGEVPLLLAPVLGIRSAAVQVEATAALVNNFAGFRAPASGGNLNLLPFALDLQTWNNLLDGQGSDDWTWDDDLEQVSPGPDGILEANLYPQGTGSPGNRGTVDIGSNNNSTADLARQIVDGISPEDLAFHGGALQLDENGQLQLNADTGISAGVKDELESIKGQPRIICIFSQVSGNGNNAQYTIVNFAGVRIMDVKLTGSMPSKRVIIQPANIVTGGGIASPAPYQISYFVYSPVWLVR